MIITRKYLYNLISYVLGNEVYAGARELTGGKEKSYLLDLDKCFYVDLKPYVNKSFKDEVDADKKGGWTDQGENDLRHMPVGDDNPENKYWQLVYHQEIKGKQIFLGVPFEVIDPAKNRLEGPDPRFDAQHVPQAPEYAGMGYRPPKGRAPVTSTPR